MVKKLDRPPVDLVSFMRRVRGLILKEKERLNKCGYNEQLINELLADATTVLEMCEDGILV